ncbi:MAG: hypothetical protein FWG21_00665 [Oscillospiraceae bacterium]|nr:hypothetical protein [Oscillospiraceae bacterium]
MIGFFRIRISVVSFMMIVCIIISGMVGCNRNNYPETENEENIEKPVSKAEIQSDPESDDHEMTQSNHN